MARPNNRIDEELVCIDSLHHVLERELGLAVGAPTRVEPGEDPPDFWLQIAETDTPVEITSITQRAAFNHHARQMAKTLKERALDADILHGTYVLKFRRFPPIPHPRRKRDRRIYDSAMDFISRTANLNAGVELDIFDEHSGHIVLTKLSPSGATVAEMLTHTEWEGESQEKIRDLISVAAKSKIEKLGKNGHSSKSVILALYDAYAFVEFDSIVECTAELECLNAFGAVYWASAFADRENFTYPDQPGRDGGFIASSIEEWRGANSLPKNAEQ
ncbi:MAG TPA: hypothetical protein DDW52_23260 [Planctomycetaceae bacterium]|nr:hypothetical protein [Planctomycetaceae bacterium]